MSLYTDFHYRFSRLKNKRLDHSGARTKKRHVPAGRYLRLYVTTIVGYDEVVIHNQPRMIGGSYPSMVYPKRSRYRADDPYIFQDTLIRHNVCLKYSQEALQFCEDLCTAVREKKLEVYEVRSILDGESLDKAAFEVGYMKWQNKECEKMLEEIRDKQDRDFANIWVPD